MNNNDILTELYDKKVECPICGHEFSTKCVKVNSSRVIGRDSDYFNRYSKANPYLYDIWLCDKCGYAAMKSDFPKIKSFEKELVLLNITPKWKSRIFPDILKPEHAIERYKLALINATILKRPNGTLGFILLKIAWMYRLLDNNKDEILFLNQSLNCFLKAFTEEPFPIYGLQRDSLTYLIGDLYRRTNQDDQALIWYSNVITTVGASQKVKDMARDGRDLIKNKESVQSE